MAILRTLEIKYFILSPALASPSTLYKRLRKANSGDIFPNKSFSNTSPVIVKVTSACLERFFPGIIQLSGVAEDVKLRSHSSVTLSVSSSTNAMHT